MGNLCGTSPDTTVRVYPGISLALNMSLQPFGRDFIRPLCE